MNGDERAPVSLAERIALRLDRAEENLEEVGRLHRHCDSLRCEFEETRPWQWLRRARVLAARREALRHSQALLDENQALMTANAVDLLNQARS